MLHSWLSTAKQLDTDLQTWVHIDIVAINVNSEVANRGSWCDMVSTNSQSDLWQLMLPSIPCAPDNFGLCSVQLEPVRLHPADTSSIYADTVSWSEVAAAYRRRTCVAAGCDAQRAAVGPLCRAGIVSQSVSVREPIPAALHTRRLRHQK